MTLSVLLMSIGSLLIAIVPPYGAIGVFAPIVLLLARLLQGLSRPLAHDEARARFWVRHLRIGVALTMGTASMMIVYALATPDRPHAWRQWRFAWKPAPGRHVVRARATDSSGDVQPETTPWNKSGYLWNGIESVAFEVRP